MSKEIKKQSLKREQITPLINKFAPTTDREWTKLSNPPMIKPSQMEGRSVAGKIVSVNNSTNKQFKNKILVVQHDSGDAFSFPVTFTVQRALESYFQAAEGQLDWQKPVGYYIKIDGLGKVATKDGKRTVNLFDVSIAPA